MSEVSKKILIVDDEEHVLTYLSALLEDNGYQTLLARNGSEGLELAQKEKPDLVTLDITMPEESGIAMYRKMRENDDLSGIPVIVVTAVTGAGGDPKAFENFLSTRKQVPPPEAFISKPVDREQFLEAVATHSGKTA